MRFQSIHRWDLNPREAIALQEQLAARVELTDRVGDIRTVAGADMSIDVRTGTGFAGVIVFEFPSLREVERASAAATLSFPYVPGLLSFREGPVLLKAFEQLSTEPDVVLFDGQGVAHPRRVGIASHMGLLLDRPTIGCAKSLLCGTYREPGPKKGDREPLLDAKTGLLLGTILRTRDHVKPIFVSPGHRLSHPTTVEIVMQCLDGYRIPRPTRLADHFVGAIKPHNIQ